MIKKIICEQCNKEFEHEQETTKRDKKYCPSCIKDRKRTLLAERIAFGVDRNKEKVYGKDDSKLAFESNDSWY